MDDLLFYVLFEGVILRQCKGDNERLCAMEPHLWLQIFLTPLWIEPGTARSAGQHLTHRATRVFMVKSAEILIPIVLQKDTMKVTFKISTSFRNIKTLEILHGCTSDNQG